MNDAPPVTRTRFPVQKVSAGFTLFHPLLFYFSPRAQAAENVHKFLQLVNSIIGRSRGQRGLGHFLQFCRGVRKVADHLSYFLRAVGISSDAEAHFFAQRDRIGVVWRDRSNWLSRRQYSVPFA